MIHYHGTPIGGKREDVAKFLSRRHCLIPFPRPEDIYTAAEVCTSFCVDNGAFTAWKRGDAVFDWVPYYNFVEGWYRHPAFDWALIPDVIDGSEADNDALIAEWPRELPGVPVWHLHESIDRLVRLCHEWDRVALGSSGEWATPGTDGWWRRTSEAMDVICDPQGRPPCKLHGLRMLNPEIFTQLPLASADSTNAAQNASLLPRFGMYVPPNRSTRLSVIAERIEAFQSAAVWQRRPIEASLFATE